MLSLKAKQYWWFSGFSRDTGKLFKQWNCNLHTSMALLLPPVCAFGHLPSTLPFHILFGAIQFRAATVLEMFSGAPPLLRGPQPLLAPSLWARWNTSRFLKLGEPDPNRIDTKKQISPKRPEEEKTFGLLIGYQDSQLGRWWKECSRNPTARN